MEIRTVSGAQSWLEFIRTTQEARRRNEVLKSTDPAAVARPTEMKKTESDKNVLQELMAGKGELSPTRRISYHQNDVQPLVRQKILGGRLDTYA